MRTIEARSAPSAHIGAMGLAALLGSANARTLSDNFDNRLVDGSKWMSTQIKPEQIAVAQPGSYGPAAVTILTRGGDGGEDCPAEEAGRCQRPIAGDQGGVAALG
jgi:hypothetical protein